MVALFPIFNVQEVAKAIRKITYVILSNSQEKTASNIHTFSLARIILLDKIPVKPSSLKKNLIKTLSSVLLEQILARSPTEIANKEHAGIRIAISWI